VDIWARNSLLLLWGDLHLDPGIFLQTFYNVAK